MLQDQSFKVSDFIFSRNGRSLLLVSDCCFFCKFHVLPDDLKLDKVPSDSLVVDLLEKDTDATIYIYITESLIGFMLLLEYPTAGRIRL